MDSDAQENKKRLEDVVFDWNRMTLDQCIQYLESKHMFSSSGEAHCVMKLIGAYKKLKNE